MGTPMREILEEHAGGMQDGFGFAALLPGGASTDFLVDDHLDVAMDFESVQKAGSRLGTGTMIVLDDQDLSRRHGAQPRAFLRAGIVRLVHALLGRAFMGRPILRDMEDGTANPAISSVWRPTRDCSGPGHTFCALAPGAAEPLQSGAEVFHATISSATSANNGVRGGKLTAKLTQTRAEGVVK